MNLRKQNRNGRLYLIISKSYRDENNVPRNKTIKTIGYLDEAHKKYPDIDGDPLEYFIEMTKKMKEEALNNAKEELTIDYNQTIDTNTDNIFIYGSIILSKLFHQLELHEFFLNKAKYLNIKFIPKNIVQLLVYSRILNPSSKRATLDFKNKFFDLENRGTTIYLHHIYRTLDFLAPLKDDLIAWCNHRIENNLDYKRETSIIFYDVTNYYFYDDMKNEYYKINRKTKKLQSFKKSKYMVKGFSKEKRTKSIVQMGLAIDNKGIPITYQLYSGNTPDISTYDQILLNLQNDYKSERLVIVADRGLNSGDNIGHSYLEDRGYIFGQSIKKLSQFEIDNALGEPEKFKEIYDENEGLKFKVKSSIESKVIKVTSKTEKTKSGRPKKINVEIDQKKVVMYSKKYATRAKAQREELIAKAKLIIRSPKRYDKAYDSGALSYILNGMVDKETGEIVRRNDNKLIIDDEKIKEEEKYDGYYMIVTSETKMSDKEIMAAYHGLWKIEETFKVTKSCIKSRPIYHWTDKRIEAHFLTCYISILLLRLLQLKTNNKYSCEKLVETINNITCTQVEGNKYLFGYRSDVSDHISKALAISLDKLWMRKSDINKSFSNLRS
jgi:transposase